MSLLSKETSKHKSKVNKTSSKVWSTNSASWTTKTTTKPMNLLRCLNKRRLWELRYHRRMVRLGICRMILVGLLCTTKVSKEKTKTSNTPSLKTKSWDKDSKALFIRTMGLCQSGSRSALHKTLELLFLIKRDKLWLRELITWMNSSPPEHNMLKIARLRLIKLWGMLVSWRVWSTASISK